MVYNFKIFNPKKVEIVEEFKAYSIRWECKSGYVNFHTILGINDNIKDHDICLTCGKTYEIRIEGCKNTTKEI